MSSTERPRLRPRLRFSRHESDGAVMYVVKDPTSLKYYRFGQLEAWLMQRMDGTRTLPQICDELRAEIGVSATPQKLDVLVRRLREMGLVERTLEERSALLMERMRQQRRIRRQSKSTILRMRFSVGDPDPALGVMVQRLPHFWTREFVATSIAVFALYLLIVSSHWDAFVAGMAVLYSPVQMTLGIFVICYGSFVISAIIHEMGHALTCKRHGGEVHEMGAMLLYFMPAFYCNVSDAWTFEKRSQRLWVTAAGGWIQLWVAAAAAVVWIVTEPGTLLNTIGLYTAVLSGGFSLLLNYNPLIPLDGYYALVDVLNMPNLRARAFAYVGAAVKRYVLRLDAPMPPVTERERRIFLIYGILSMTYTATILTSFAILVGRFLTARLGGWGWALFAVLLLAVTRRMRAGAARTWRLFSAQKLPRGRRARVAGGAALALLVLLVVARLVPWTVYATGDAIVEPVMRTWLRPPQAARFIEVRASDGAHVRAGDTVAVLREPDIEIQRAQLQATLFDLGAQAAAARATRDAGAARLAELTLQTQRARLDLLEQRRAALVLRAPFDGVVVTPLLTERIGETVVAGDSLIELWADGDLRARVTVPQRNVGELGVGAGLRLRFPSHPSITWRANVERIETAATDEGVIAFATLPATVTRTLLPGMQGRARVVVAHTSVAGAVGRALRRLVRTDFFL